MSVDFLVTYDLNTGEYLFYSDNELYQNIQINGVLACPISSAPISYIACGEEETEVEPGVTYYIYIYNEETEDYEYKIVENPTGSPYEQEYYRKQIEIIRTMVDTSVKSYVRELQPEDFTYSEELGGWYVDLGGGVIDIEKFMVQNPEDISHKQEYYTQNVEMVYVHVPQEEDFYTQKFIIETIASIGESRLETILADFNSLVVMEQPTQTVRYQVFYTEARELVEDKDYNILLYNDDLDLIFNDTLLSIAIVDGLLCLGDYETYLDYEEEEPEPEPETPETITVEEIGENLYAAEIDYQIEHFDEEKITYRYKVLFGRAPNTEEYTLEAKFYINEQELEVAYVGNLHIIDSSQESTEENFLITTIDGVSTLYVNEEGEYNLLISLYNLMEVPSLAGGSLVSLGNRHWDDTQQTYVVDDNYGIGINSSDTAMGLPARAISLFETNINPDDTVKVSYVMRGILGTLPPASNIDLANSTIYSQYMEGTQGIFTDNMYIGNSNQYVAYYSTDNNKKNLDIKANSISLDTNGATVDIGGQLSTIDYELGVDEWNPYEERTYFLSEDTQVVEDKIYYYEAPDMDTDLMTYPYSETTKTIYGITYTDNGDGSLTITGTSTGGEGERTTEGGQGSFNLHNFHYETQNPIALAKSKYYIEQIGIEETYLLYNIGYQNLRGEWSKILDNQQINRIMDLTNITDDIYADDYIRISIQIGVKNGQTVNNTCQLKIRPITFVPVEEIKPNDNPVEKGWYEMNSTHTTIGSFLNKHFSFDNTGLWIYSIPNEGYYSLLTDEDFNIYNSNGKLITSYGQNIYFNEDSELSIGNKDVYIKYYDSDDDGIADSLNIRADSITFGNLNLDENTVTKLLDYSSYIKIEPSVPSIQIATDPSSYMSLTSSKLSLVNNYIEVASLSDERMHIPSATVNNLYMQMINAETGERTGGIGWVMRTNGHLSMRLMK